MKSKTTKAVANRGVGTDAPCGENKDLKRRENFMVHRTLEKFRDLKHVAKAKTFSPERKDLYSIRRIW